MVTGSLFRTVETLSLQLSIWLSAPLGMAIAEWLLRRGRFPVRTRRVGREQHLAAPA